MVGIDNSPDMVRIAKANFPSPSMPTPEEGFNAVFSNGPPFKEAEQVLDSIAGCLKPGGRIVAEMGGRGNIESVVSALRRALTAKLGHPRAEVDPWYFPTIGQYSALLEQRGLEVSFANHFSRPTPLKEGEEGLRDWIRMFCSEFLAGLDPDIENSILTLVEEELRPTLFDGVRWVVDYRRLRFQAHRIG